jgi:hypothetical protein
VPVSVYAPERGPRLAMRMVPLGTNGVGELVGAAVFVGVGAEVDVDVGGGGLGAVVGGEAGWLQAESTRERTRIAGPVVRAIGLADMLKCPPDLVCES